MLIHSSSQIVRKVLGVTQEEFADRFGVRLENLKRWEHGDGHPSWHEEALLWYVAQDPLYVEGAFKAYRCITGRTA
jgi:DNA-binding transcriptional regulator YiaG